MTFGRTAIVGTILGAAAMLVMAASAASGKDGEASQQIDALFRAAYSDSAPGAAVIVVKDGQTILRKGYGLANLEHGIPVTPQTVFRLGSVTKQFTAMAILMLEEEGKLSLDDSITVFLPNFPMGDEPITIAHLLSHTSGIQSYTNMSSFWQHARDDLAPDEMIDLFKDEPREFAPGEKWTYSNSGYFLLGRIIEKVSGKSYAEFVRERIFAPLSMNNSYYGSHTRIIPNRATGYEGEGGTWQNAGFISMTPPFSAGALLSTVDDMARWDAALYTQNLVPKEALERYFTPFLLDNGEPTEYAYGWMISELQGSPVAAHGGGIRGFMSFVIRVPEKHAYVAVLTNCIGHEPSAPYLARKAAAIAIGRPFEERTEVRLPRETLDRYVGVYRIDEENVRYVTRHDDYLCTQRLGGPIMQACASSETEFFYPNALSDFEFALDDDGNVMYMLMHQNGREKKAVRTDEPLPSLHEEITMAPETLDRYVGEYELMPGFLLKVFRDKNRLMLQATGQVAVQIFPESETEFFLKIVDAQLSFVFDSNGAVEKVILHQGGQDLPGNKVN